MALGAILGSRLTRRMSMNLLQKAYVLKDEKDRRELISAMNTFGPPGYRTNPLSCNSTVPDLVLLNREPVINALRARGTARARDIAEELESDEPVFAPRPITKPPRRQG
jgi:hypothetical protein